MPKSLEQVRQNVEDIKKQINGIRSLLAPLLRRPTVIKFEVIFDNNYQRKLAILVKVYNDFGIGKTLLGWFARRKMWLRKIKFNDESPFKFVWIDASNGKLIREYI